MKTALIGQPYGRELREITFIPEAGRVETFIATDGQAREFAAENGAMIEETAAYGADVNLADPYMQRLDERRWQRCLPMRR